MEEIKINYGALGKTLKEQMREQGYSLKNDEMLEQIRKAICVCGFNVATRSQTKAMFNKLNKKVLKNIVLLEK